MKIVAMADVHNTFKFHIPDGDTLIVCGDLTYTGNLSELRTTAEYISKLPHPNKIVIAGNHDFCLEGRKFRQPFVNERTQIEAEDILFEAGLKYLNGSLVEIDGIGFYGAPWTPMFHNWAFNVDRGSTLDSLWDRIPDNTDVVLAHGPPFGYGDRVANGERVGCSSLLKAIDKRKPRVVCFGHIHEDVGEWTRGTTKLINCSVGYPVYRGMPQHQPVVFELEKRQ